jgi:ribose/xylose/arabinose/galactoside ABC-type transport system permease subunit
VEKVEKAKKWNIDGIVPLKKISERRELGVVIPLIVFFMIFALRSPNFYSSDNIMNISSNQSTSCVNLTKAIH